MSNKEIQKERSGALRLILLFPVVGQPSHVLWILPRDFPYARRPRGSWGNWTKDATGGASCNKLETTSTAFPTIASHSVVPDRLTLRIGSSSRRAAIRRSLTPRSGRRLQVHHKSPQKSENVTRSQAWGIVIDAALLISTSYPTVMHNAFKTSLSNTSLYR